VEADLKRRFAAVAVLSAALAGTLAPASASPGVCAGFMVTIAGTAGPDELTGTPARDVIHGYGGNDVIVGLGGDDVLCGGGGDDDIDAGDGNDIVYGGRGSDVVVGGVGEDVLRGGAGGDNIDGGSGDDVLVGGSGADRLFGRSGRDTAFANRGDDVLDGGPQGDRLFGGPGADTLLGRFGNDSLDGGGHADTVLGGHGNDSLRGRWGGDKLVGGPGDDTALGDGGDDTCRSATRLDGCEGPVYRETFDGDPTSPTPITNSTDLTVSVNSRIGATQHRLPAMEADHNTSCDPPPRTHTITDYEDAVYTCRGHLMTAITSGFFPDRTNMAVAMFSPNQVLDFTGGPATIRFEMSTLRASRRDWFEVWLTPFDDLLRIPVQADRVIMQGPPENGLVVMLRDFSEKGVFDATVVDGFVETEIEGSATGYESVLTPSRTQRATIEIVVERDHLKVWMPDHGLVFIDRAIPRLPFSKGIVQFGHNSYEVFECQSGCDAGPATWHWDDIELAPAEPLIALPASRRFVNALTPSFVRFPEPAPSDSWIQFTAIGFDLEVSFDLGESWQPALTQHDRESYVWRYRNYWMQVPEDTTTMHVRGRDTSEHMWQVQDISILVRPEDA
jgi:hypothetical protein